MTVDRTPSKELNEDLWQFPMDYPIKLIGLAVPALAQEVVTILQNHFPDFDANSIEIQPSSKGTYHSIRAHLKFETKEQVHAVYADLAACPHIKTAL